MCKGLSKYSVSTKKQILVLHSFFKKKLYRLIASYSSYIMITVVIRHFKVWLAEVSDFVSWMVVVSLFYSNIIH